MSVLHCKSSSLGFFRKLSMSSLAAAAAVVVAVVVGAVSTEEKRVWPVGKGPHPPHQRHTQAGADLV